MTAAVLPQVPTTLYYYLEPKDGGVVDTYPGTAAEKRREHVPKDAVVRDMRPSKEDFTVDSSGFQLVDHESVDKTFDNEDEIRKTYYPEVANLIKKVTGASHVHVFSHLCRRETNEASIKAAEGKEDHEFVKTMNPARFCHVDQSYRGAEQVLYLNLPEEEADRRSQSRWGIINVWRPIGAEVTRDPLAVCDFRSLDERDLRTVVANLPAAGDYSTVSKGANYEVWNLAQNPEQKWYYASRMKPEEALLIKIFDTKKDGRARCTPHTSFPLQTDDGTGPPRQSIEMRCLVFWDGESVE